MGLVVDDVDRLCFLEPCDELVPCIAFHQIKYCTDAILFEVDEEHFVLLVRVAVGLHEFLDEFNDVFVKDFVEHFGDLVDGAVVHGVFDEENRHVEFLKV